MAKVCDRSPALIAQTYDVPMLEALMAGTREMRARGKQFLPVWAAEEDEVYKARLQTATLFPAYRRTVEVMAAKPFSKELQLSENTPANIKSWCENVDREGVNLHAFAAEMFAETFYGLAGILVDTPKPPPSDAPVPTVAQQRAAGMRPYFVRIKHDQLVGWKIGTVKGARGLTQLRFKETVTEDDGLYGEREITQIRVLEIGRWEVHREVKEGEWVMVDNGTTPLDEIPFTPCYGFRKAFMVGEPPLVDLAYLNVKHWQSQSDQDTILHVARVPLLFAKGFQSTDAISVGVAAAVIGGPDSDMKYVEHNGASIEAGAKSLDDLEDQMIQAGAELLVKRPGTRTATESTNDAEANKSDLQRMAESFEDSLDRALSFMAKLGGEADLAKVTLFKDFGAATLGAASAVLIKDLAAAGIISKRTARAELKRRGELSADVDVDAEADRVEEEGPDLASITKPPLPAPKIKPEPKRPAPASA